LDDDQRDARELALPARAQRLARVGVLGDVDGADVRRERAAEDHGLDDRPVDAVDRDDDPLFAVRALDDQVVADVELLLLAGVLAVDERHHPDEQRHQQQDEQRRWRLGDGDDDRDDGGQDGPERVDREPRPPARRPLAAPVADHAGLTDREVDEHADRVERDQQVRLALGHDDQGRRERREDDDPPREREAVAAERELAGHEAVLGEDREQPREGVEARVRGEDEEDGRERLEQQEGRRPGAVDDRGDLADDRLPLGLVDGHDPVARREERDPDEQHAEEAGHDPQRRRRVSRLRRLEPRHAGRDRLDTGQRDGAGGERPEDEDHRDGLDRVAALLDDRRVPLALAEDDDPERADRDHQQRPEQEQVRRQGEDVARLAEPAEVADRDQGDAADADQDAFVEERGKRRRDLLDGRGGRDGDRHDVVDQQRRRGDER